MPGPVQASGVEAEKVTWKWRNRFPEGMITLVAGKPDQGKGLLAAHVAAEVSAAGGRVLYSAAEDSAGMMTRPRLEAAGANLENVLLWRFVLPKNGRELAEIVIDSRSTTERTKLLPNGEPNPKYRPEKVPIDLIVIDPLASHLGGGISRHSDNVRQVLSPLTELIETTGTSVLIIEHALKRVPKSGHPLDAIGGSGSGVPAAARAAFVFGRDPDDEDRRILAPAKFNLGPMPKALAFEIDVGDVETVGETPFLMVDEEILAFDAMRLFDTTLQPAKIGRPADKRAAASEWLVTYLVENGPTKAGAIQEDAKQYGMSAKTLRRAAEDMGVVKSAGGGPNTTWDLPDDVKELMGMEVEEEDTRTPAEKLGDLADATAELDEVDTSDMDAGLEALLGGGDDDGDQ